MIHAFKVLYNHVYYSFGKNGEEPILAFHDVDAAELFPCVLFYSTNPGEKVITLLLLPRTYLHVTQLQLVVLLYVLSFVLNFFVPL